MEGAPEQISLASVLEWDCYRTIAYFAYFRYPLTAFEVWKWLYAPEGRWTLADVTYALATSTWLGERVGASQGFYGVGDVDVQVADRHERLLDALRKYRVLAPVVAYLRRLPFIDGVAVCNSLAFHHTTAASDIDLFIVTAPGRVWSARLLAVSAMAALRKRPGEARRDPVCCSFFADRNALDMARLKIDDEHDPYLAFWTHTLVPLVDRGDVFSRVHVMNGWVRDVLPNARPVSRAPRLRHGAPRRGFIRDNLAALFPEDAARAFQERKFPASIRALKNVDTRVVVNDRMLKFHENDRRHDIKRAHDERLCNIS
ncbi:hypothetical protein HYS28_01295 [Candidatus Uhrbacteria bacterium]|nr:hypothetical protein [Candidatus Uhrbacteria bacterium]